MTYRHVDINRTASSSVREALNINRRPKHTTALHLRREAPEAFLFSFVRHPYGRVLSQWKHRETYHGGEAFSEWLRRVYMPPYRRGNQPEERYRRRLWWPQRRWLCDEDGDIAVDWVGTFESLGVHFEVLCNHVDVDAQLPHRNRAHDRRRWWEVYSNKDKRIVAVAHGQDFNEFNYDSYLG